MKPGRIYLDYNATTPLCPAAQKAMSIAMATLWGNPSSVHAEGQAARSAVERAREQVATLVGAASRDLILTSGATESINWVHRQLRQPGCIITTPVEHPAVAGACQRALEGGAATDLVRLPVDEGGRLDPQTLSDALEGRSDVVLVSVMLANNETGNLYPIEALAAICQRHSVTFHCDATQAVGRIPVNLTALGVDLASFSAHKMYGPKGVGALYVRPGFRLDGFIVGGHQERSRRSGTENLLGIVGFGSAAQDVGDLDAEAERQRALRNGLWERIQTLAPVTLNGDPLNGLPNTLNVSFAGCPADGLLMALDLAGVSVSAGSACSAGSLEPSAVLLALTADRERQRSALRFSLGRLTTQEQVEQAFERLQTCVQRMRRDSGKV